MRILTLLLAMLLSTPLLAETFERPIPQAQNATAELWYAAACIAFVAALVAVHRMVSRR